MLIVLFCIIGNMLDAPWYYWLCVVLYYAYKKFVKPINFFGGNNNDSI